MRKKLILIGGVPGTGKTTLAYNLALKLKIDKVVSIDMMKIYSKTFEKRLNRYFYTTTHEASKIENLSVIKAYLKHSRVINRRVIKVLENIKDKIIIIEGATINNDFIKMINNEQFEFIYINLYLPKQELINRYENKKKLRNGSWIENIENIEKIKNYLMNDGVNVVNENLNNTVERVMEYVGKDICVQQ